jgi:hypothetical protein
MINFSNMLLYKKRGAQTMGRLSMRKISEVFRQRFELKRSYREVARSLNISTSTVSDYLARARIAQISRPFPEGLSEQELYDKLFLPVDQDKAERPQPDDALNGKTPTAFREKVSAGISSLDVSTIETDRPIKSDLPFVFPAKDLI